MDIQLIFIILVLGVMLCGAFYGGAYLGIKDVKNKFNIPKGAIGVNDDGEYIFY